MEHNTATLHICPLQGAKMIKNARELQMTMWTQCSTDIIACTHVDKKGDIKCGWTVNYQTRRYGAELSQKSSLVVAGVKDSSSRTVRDKVINLNIRCVKTGWITSWRFISKNISSYTLWNRVRKLKWPCLRIDEQPAFKKSRFLLVREFNISTSFSRGVAFTRCKTFELVHCRTWILIQVRTKVKFKEEQKSNLEDQTSGSDFSSTVDKWTHIARAGECYCCTQGKITITDRKGM